MYGKQFFDRLSWQQVCEFLQYGWEGDVEEGTLEERYQSHDLTLIELLHTYRKDILAVDWRPLDGKKTYIATESLYQDLLCEIGARESLSFQAGFAAGLQLDREPMW